MSKIIKLIAVILVLTFMLTGCENTSVTSHSQKETLQSVPITSYSREEIAQFKQIKEQKINDELYEEFLTIFKDFVGFDFEKYLFIPEETTHSHWLAVKYMFSLELNHILEKNEAENLLEILRNHPYYRTYYTSADLSVYQTEKTYAYTDYSDTGRENKSECYYFVRSGKYVDTNVRRSVRMELLPTDNTCNKYLMHILAFLERDPPEGQACWPEEDGVRNSVDILLDKTGKPIGNG